MPIRTSLLAAGLALALAGCNKDKDNTSSAASAGAVALGQPVKLGAISVSPPQAWTATQPTSSMRRAQWRVPEAPGVSAAQPTELVVFYFGQGGGGSVEDNLKRWYDQFQQPDGKPSSEAAVTLTATIAGMKVTKTEVAGRYVAQVTPGAEQRHDVPASRMLAAIVEAPDGAYYFKMVGPDATVTAAKPGFDALLGSLSK